MLKRVIAAGGSCEGCFFYLGNSRKGAIHCSKSAIPAYEDIDCVEYDTVNPTQLVHYIFKESCNEEQNETMAP